MKKLILIGSLSLLATSVQAELRINGFANLIGGITSSDDSMYGYDDDFSFTSESLFAVQVSGDINSKMTATGQIVARGKNDYEPDFEWAYITYQATDNLSVSAGRIRQPLFRYSTSSDVGYSYHWVNSPRVIYDVPTQNMDGVRFDYSGYSGDWEYNMQLGLGSFSGDFLGNKLAADNLLIASAELSRDWFKVRGVYGVTKVSTTGPELTMALDVIRSLGLPEFANDLASDKDTGTFTGVGMEVDKFDWFIMAEYTITEAKETFVPKTVSYYLSAGMRAGKWTPSVTYEKKDSANQPKFTDRLIGLPAEPLAIATQIGVGLQLGSMEEYSVTSVGVRYDLDTNVALKADVSKRSDDLDDTRDATAVRFAINYIF
ncbi:topoisomerase IV [Paraglaciecola sp.]|uniref:topoisomerase IV n=1 Tax=Paraglaciecola sp. TaxID=1920173 RepID=UPI00273F6C68|nr:topoisomerase IV [Paraglaciecola sp.]MDP5032955.1 topoisomerase IV [Paraglaciecola sp.]